MAVAAVAQSQRIPAASSPTKPEVVVRLISAEDKNPMIGARTTNNTTDITCPSANSPSKKDSLELSPEPNTPKIILPPSSPSLAALASAALQLQQPASPASTVSGFSQTFVSLPADIQYLIATEFLPYHSVVALRSTSSYFHSLISAPTLKRLRKQTIQNLLIEERQILDKWLAYGGDSRPSQNLTCYACLKSQPITEFLATQVQGARGVGRKFAGLRWCKTCGLKRGKIRRGRWYSQVSYGVQDKFYYEVVMKSQLNVEIHCAKCPPRRRVDGEALWWGCVGCFEKEEMRIQKMDSERRRNIRLHCYQAKLAAQSMIDPTIMADRTKYLGRWVRETFGWSGITSRSWRVAYWFTEETPWDRLCRNCDEARSWVDRIDVKGSRLGKKARNVTDRLLRRHSKAGQGQSEQDGQGLIADCFICAETVLEPTTIAILEHIEGLGESPTPNTHMCVKASRHEVRCSGCWRAKRSRRRRRYDWGMAYGSPLAERNWCEGCQVERQSFIRSERERKVRKVQMREQLSPRKPDIQTRPVKFKLPDADIDLRGLFDIDGVGNMA